MEFGLYYVTTQAVVTPNNKLKPPTPTIKIIVLVKYLGNTVENKCGHSEVSPRSAE